MVTQRGQRFKVQLIYCLKKKKEENKRDKCDVKHYALT